MNIPLWVQHRGVGSSLLTTWYMTSDTTVPRTFYDHRHFWSARHQKIKFGRILSTFKNLHSSWKSLSTRYYHHGHHFAHQGLNPRIEGPYWFQCTSYYQVDRCWEEGKPIAVVLAMIFTIFESGFNEQAAKFAFYPSFSVFDRIQNHRLTALMLRFWWIQSPHLIIYTHMDCVMLLYWERASSWCRPTIFLQHTTFLRQHALYKKYRRSFIPGRSIAAIPFSTRRHTLTL